MYRWGSEWSIKLGGVDFSVGSFGGTIFEICNNEPNNLPEVTVVVYSFREDVTGSFVLLGTDADADKVTFRIQGSAANGEVVLNNPSTGAATYTPRLHWCGTDTITVVANDGKEDGPPQQLMLEVAPVADAPEVRREITRLYAASTLLNPLQPQRPPRPAPPASLKFAYPPLLSPAGTIESNNSSFSPCA